MYVTVSINIKFPLEFPIEVALYFYCEQPPTPLQISHVKRGIYIDDFLLKLSAEGVKILI